MPFIGAVPAQKYISLAKQDFTTIAGTGYTLDQSVTNEVDIALFINHVRQEPTTAYTASGTTLTLTSATTTSDDMYCVFLAKATESINPPSGSVGLDQLSATGTKDSTTFLRGDNTFASAGGTNTPAFEATLSAAQTLTDNTYTKVQFNTENFDTDSDYDNATNYRFTPSVAGKYYFYLNIDFDSGGAGQFERAILTFYKNGTAVHNQIEGESSQQNGNKRGIFSIQKIIDMNGSSDYVEAFVFLEHDGQGAGSVRSFSSNKSNIFGAYKIIQ